MDSDYGDPDVDFEAAMLEERLRELFNDIPDTYPGSEVEISDAVHAAVSVGWPDGAAPPADDVSGEQAAAGPDVIDTGDTDDEQTDNGVHSGAEYSAEPGSGAPSDSGFDDVGGAIDHELDGT